MDARRGWAITLCVLLTGCASPVDDSADVALHLQQRLDAAFAPNLGDTVRPAAVPVRLALPNGWGDLMRRCMNDSGYAGYEYDRFYGFTNNGEQAKQSGAEGLAWYACAQGLPESDTV